MRIAHPPKIILLCPGYVHAQYEKKIVSTFTVSDPKIEAYPTEDYICRHTKAHDNLLILGKNKAIKAENITKQRALWKYKGLQQHNGTRANPRSVMKGLIG